MAPQDKQLFMVGLPGAGKTTFLAALWHGVESHESTAALKLRELKGNATYLNSIRMLWIDAQKLERTKLGEETNVHMALQDSVGNTCNLWIPDVSGEACEAQWTDRIAKIDYCNWVRASSGGLLFVHPDIREEHLISEVAALIPKLTDKANEDASTIEVEENSREWDPRLAPTQVQLVDLVQSLVMLRASKPIRLALVVSAWDRVVDETIPEQWIAKRVPLLYQYITSHRASIKPTYFGISAQGADFKTPGAVDQMRSCHNPSDRIRVYDSEDRGHDITLPICWLMQLPPYVVGSLKL